MASQRAGALASHGVSLVGHCRASNLILLERLLDLFQVSQQTDICGDLVDGCTKGGHGHQDVNINLAGISLARDGVVLLESGKLCHTLVKSFHLVMIALEEGQERCLGSSRSLDPTESNVLTSTSEIAKIPKQLLDPKSGTFADSCQLGRLKVGEAQGREVFVLLCKGAEALDDTSELGQEDIETIAKDDKISVVGHIARGGTQVNDTRSAGAGNAKGVDVCHNIVATLLLLGSSQSVVDIILDIVMAEGHVRRVS